MMKGIGREKKGCRYKIQRHVQAFPQRHAVINVYEEQPFFKLFEPCGCVCVLGGSTDKNRENRNCLPPASM